jgi:hypothetical protein
MDNAITMRVGDFSILHTYLFNAGQGSQNSARGTVVFVLKQRSERIGGVSDARDHGPNEESALTPLLFNREQTAIHVTVRVGWQAQQTLHVRREQGILCHA